MNITESTLLHKVCVTVDNKYCSVLSLPKKCSIKSPHIAFSCSSGKGKLNICQQQNQVPLILGIGVVKTDPSLSLEEPLGCSILCSAACILKSPPGKGIFLGPMEGKS